MLISSLQNITMESRHLFESAAKNLLNHEQYVDNYLKSDFKSKCYTGVRYTSGPNVVSLFSQINMLFVTLNSQMDYITKLIYEYQHLQEYFSDYKKLKSKNVLFGDKGKLKIEDEDKKNTIYEENCATIRLIENYRNLIIHDGSLNFMNQLYQKYEEGNIIEQFILLPDTTNGNLDKFKGRSRFYGRETKWNEFMPELLTDYETRLMNTLRLIGEPPKP